MTLETAAFSCLRVASGLNLVGETFCVCHRGVLGRASCGGRSFGR
jgi:hypothetical protein